IPWRIVVNLPGADSFRTLHGHAGIRDPGDWAARLNGRPDDVDQRDYVQSLERGLSVILAFADHHPRLTLAEVAAATGLSRPTARRLLITLEALGYVRVDGRAFTLTPS